VFASFFFSFFFFGGCAYCNNVESFGIVCNFSTFFFVCVCVSM